MQPERLPTLFVVPGSHPSMTGRLLLEHKRIAYRRVDLLPAIHKPLLRMLGFADTTVPAFRLGDHRVQSTLTISRLLEQLQPEPPLFPASPLQRLAVEEAERWGESVLQPLPRRLSWWALARDRNALRSFATGARLRVPLELAIRTAKPIVAVERRINHATDAGVRADMALLPRLLKHVDLLLADGIIGGEQPNAADYQIATSVRLLACFDDLRAWIDQRPCGAYAHRVVPEFPGRIGPVLPEDWLLQADAAA